MSTPFKPLEIPPGVVATPTRHARSTNWSAANCVRWVEGKMQPIGGQELISYASPFASPCREIHAWYDLAGVYHTAYLCEQNVYVDTNGVLAEITPAGGLPAVSTPSGGYGMGAYGMGSYGAPPRPGETFSGELFVLPPVFSLDNFGALLLVMSSADGRLLSWDPAVPATPLTHVTGSPNGRCFVVTSDRFIMVFGALTADGLGGPRRFAWCDQADPTDWDYASVTNQAGWLDIEAASPIITAIAVKSGAVLFFTAKKAYISRYLGLPYVYDYEELADDCTPWSPASITTTSALVMWFAEQGAFSFDGSAVNPIACPIRTWITGDIDPIMARFQAFAVHIGEFSEFWWFYPQNGSQTNTRAAIYAYKEGWWSEAQMSRSAGMSSVYTSLPIFADGVQAYQHESGTNYNDCDLPWAETFSLNLASGGRLATLKQMIIDLDGDPTALELMLYCSNSRLSTVPETVVGPKLIRSDGYVDWRTTARDMRIRIQAAGPQALPWTLGQSLVDVVQRGDR